jgi:DNA-binding beta-propeller fold protein YncE
VSLSGEKLWARAMGGLTARTAVSSAYDRIYLVDGAADGENYLYVLDKDGNELTRSTSPAAANPNIKPAVGPDGIVYLATSELSAFSPEGELLFKFPTHPFNQYFPYGAPSQILSVRNNTLLSGYTGIMALQSVPQNGLNVLITGGDFVSYGTFKDLRVEITNYQAQTDADVEIVLEDAATGKAVSRAVISETLVTGKLNVYNFGVKIPLSGDLRLTVRVTDKEQNILYGKEIAVRR